MEHWLQPYAIHPSNLIFGSMVYMLDSSTQPSSRTLAWYTFSLCSTQALCVNVTCVVSSGSFPWKKMLSNRFIPSTMYEAKWIIAACCVQFREEEEKAEWTLYEIVSIWIEKWQATYGSFKIWLNLAIYLCRVQWCTSEICDSVMSEQEKWWNVSLLVVRCTQEKIIVTFAQISIERGEKSFIVLFWR